MDVPAKLVHVAHRLVEPVEVFEKPDHVVGHLRYDVVGVGGNNAAALAAHQVDLALDAEVEAQPQFGGALDLAGQDRARAHGPGRVVILEVARRPGDARPPRQLRDGARIGVDRQLVVLGSLAEPVQRGAREQLGAPHHAPEVRDGNGLGLGDAVDVDVGGEAMPDPVVGEAALLIPEFVSTHATYSLAKILPSVPRRRLNTATWDQPRSSVSCRPGSGACSRRQGRGSSAYRVPNRPTTSAA